jgi:hypothetical protein
VARTTQCEAPHHAVFLILVISSILGSKLLFVENPHSKFLNVRELFLKRKKKKERKKEKQTDTHTHTLYITFRIVALNILILSFPHNFRETLAKRLSKYGITRVLFYYNILLDSRVL